MCSGFFYFFFMDFFDIGFVLFLREALICLGIELTRGRFENFVTNWISVFCLLQNLWKVLLFVEPGNLYFSCYFNSPNLQKATGMESVFLFYPFLLTVVTARNLSIFQLTVQLFWFRHMTAALLNCCGSLAVSQFRVCIPQRSIWRPITSLRHAKAVQIQRLLQMQPTDAPSSPCFWRMHRYYPSRPNISQDSLHAWKRRKNEKKMATLHGVDRHFRGPRRQKSWP